MLPAGPASIVSSNAVSFPFPFAGEGGSEPRDRAASCSSMANEEQLDRVWEIIERVGVRHRTGLRGLSLGPPREPEKGKRPAPLYPPEIDQLL